MRNIPLSFVAEETVAEIARQHQAVRASNPSPVIKIKINQTLASRYAAEIQDHKWFLSERLGRDIGAQVAALDYLENVQRLNGARAATWKERILASLESALESDAIQGLVYSQRMLRGLPGSHRAEDFFPPTYGKGSTVTRLFVKKNWAAIQEHKWLCSERLGLDVGNKVAALDYSQNVAPLTGSAFDAVKGVAQTAWRNLLSSLDGDGPNSIANFERLMAGTRHLAR